MILLVQLRMFQEKSRKKEKKREKHYAERTAFEEFPAY
jgi:hypothetical protein